LQAPKKDTCPTLTGQDLPDASRLASYTELPGGNEAAMLEALKKGPIAVAVHVDQLFSEYSGGVFASETCNEAVNHAVVVVGAGVDADTGCE
jgi:hypothetical protein